MITCKILNISSQDEISSRLADPELKLSSRDETSFFSILTLVSSRDENKKFHENPDGDQSTCV